MNAIANAIRGAPDNPDASAAAGTANVKSRNSHFTLRSVAFFIPGAATVLIGIAFAMMVVHEDRKGTKQAAAQARIAKEDVWRLILALMIVVVAISTTFNAVTVALPKLFAERLGRFFVFLDGGRVEFGPEGGGAVGSAGD